MICLTLFHMAFKVAFTNDRGLEGHPYEDYISESKDDSAWLWGAKLPPAMPWPSESMQHLNLSGDTSEPGGQGLKHLQQSLENFTFYLVSLLKSFLDKNNNKHCFCNINHTPFLVITTYIRLNTSTNILRYQLSNNALL